MQFTDNSRQSDEAVCPRKRYWHYHAVNGYGIDRRAVNLPAATGIHIHEPADKVMQLLVFGKTKKIDLANKTTRGQIRLAIQQSLARYRAEVKAAEAFRDNSPLAEDVDFFLTEQCSLVEGFTWAWCRVMLPKIEAEFEVVCSETEESYVLGCTCGKGEKFGWEDHAVECESVVQQSRPDIVMRRKFDGALGLHDLKTHRYVGDSEILKYKSSVQMAVGTIGVERRLGEPVTHYYVHAFEKGARKKSYTPETKGFDGRKQQQSDFCYVGWTPPSPPTRREDRFETDGQKAKWYQRTPVWELKLQGRKPAEMSNVEFLVDKLPIEALQKHLFLIGPYDRQGYLLKDHLTAIEHNERRWLQKQWDIYDEVQKGTSFETALAMHVPATWECFKYGSEYPCQFYDICHQNGVSASDPLKSGLYVLRVPHHPAEMEQMKAVLDPKLLPDEKAVVEREGD